MYKIRVRCEVSCGEIAVFLMTCKALYGFSRSFYNETIDNSILIIAVAFSVIHILLSKYEAKKLILFGFVGLILCYSCYRAGEWYLVSTYLTALVISTGKIDNYVRVIMNTHVAILIICLLMSIPYYFIDRSMVCETTTMGGLRFHFLFSHPNTFSIVFTSAIFEKVWLDWEKISPKKAMAIVALFGLAYVFTKTDSLPIMCIFFLLAASRNRVFEDFVKILVRYGIPLSIAMCYLLAYLYHINTGRLSDMVRFLDTVVSRRIAIMSMVVFMNPIKLFDYGMVQYSGYNYTFGTFGVSAIDNVYLSLMYNYGLLYDLMLCVIFYKLSLSMKKKEAFWLGAFVIYALVEGQVVISLIFPALLLTYKLISYGPTIKNRGYANEFTHRIYSNIQQK